MFWSICAPKSGLGVSVVATALAVESARQAPTRLVDFDGDISRILGVFDVGSHGINDWLATDDVREDALQLLEVEVLPNLMLVPAGGPLPVAVPVERAIRLADALTADGRAVIADAGAPVSANDVRSILCARSDRTSCVVRGCYLALSRFHQLPIAVDDLVEIEEPGRSLRTIDIEGSTGLAVAARIPLDPKIARAVDAGHLHRRMPRVLGRSLRPIIEDRVLSEGRR